MLPFIQLLVRIVLTQSLGVKKDGGQIVKNETGTAPCVVGRIGFAVVKLWRSQPLLFMVLPYSKYIRRDPSATKRAR